MCCFTATSVRALYTLRPRRAPVCSVGRPWKQAAALSVFVENMAKRRDSTARDHTTAVTGGRSIYFHVIEKLDSVLRRGGNAADAALAMSACMHVLQPYTAGLGGDCFALYYDGRTKRVHCVDGSGRSPAALNLEQAQSRIHVQGALFKHSAGIYATVPGAAKAWFYIASRFGSGKLSLSELLEPAVICAEQGFPMDHVKQGIWQLTHDTLQRRTGGRYFLDTGCRIPRLGQIITNRRLAALLKRLSREGPALVCEGPVGQSIVDAVSHAGGVLSTGDLAEHLASTEPLEVDSLFTTYRGDVTVHTTPLPTQGAVLLEALNILEGFDLRDLRHVPGAFEHLLIEALRHASADGLGHVADAASGGSVKEILSKERARAVRRQLELDRRVERVYPEAAVPHGLSGTTFAAAADDSGNVCALIGSLSYYFGCAVVEEHGFAVQTRGSGFNLEAGHPNCFGPRKKPYHTLMPIMVTDTRSHDWLGTMGTMAGLPQPAILAHVLLNMLELGMNPLQALATSRFFLGTAFRPDPDGPLTVEADFPEDVLRALDRRGHTIHEEYAREQNHEAGIANILARAACWCVREETAGSRGSSANAIWCGAEPRWAGAALGY